MKVVAVRKKHGIQDPTTFLRLVSGSDAPAYAVISAGKDEVDFAANAAKINAKIGEEFAAIRRASGPMLRNLEVTSSVARPDLSYVP